MLEMGIKSVAFRIRSFKILSYVVTHSRGGIITLALEWEESEVARGCGISDRKLVPLLTVPSNY